MQNITQEKFKKAIREKYQIEKEGKNFEFLNSPSPAKLRDFCWEIFTTGRSKDDLNVFYNFFGCEFSLENRRKVFDQTDKFRSIGFFFKGKTAETNSNALDMAAILVDYELRPFNKFRTVGLNSVKENVIKEVVLDNVVKETIETEEEEVNEKTLDQEIIYKTQPVTHFLQSTPIIESRKVKRVKYIIATAIVVLIGFVIFLTLSKKECMQWSQDHYELVDCDFKPQGIAVLNPVELLDESLVNLKKVQVCDTTQYFDKNGNAVVWYAKTANGIDFFNGHGRHPENNNSLRPVTQYIINKYVKKH
ncbi:hypothetical protein ACFSJW_20045 [Flavobacterium artemisiae]|uniref:Uncharacterized protein n=1 Tax=Flavobacterium artemisiae TaxID=2126556 RepID=A0ABW4HBW8_9FLAO